MEIYVQGKHRVSLLPADFKAQGGEGSVYVKGKTAYKIYADPKKMIPAAKIQELSVLSKPEIIRPQDILFDGKQQPVGYTMATVDRAAALCQLFTKAFRDRHNIVPERMLRLVRAMQQGVSHVHANGILIVDLNEMNFLVDDAFEKVYFIDVDSYQTPGFRATALMESVRDRHATAFSEMTDWFSFAVVSFQMFTGIHPYKGKHATLKTLDERMLANVSVFSPDVGVPGTCLPFDVIPDAYRQWYRAVFDQGQRIAPPDRLDATLHIVPQIQRKVGSSQFQIEMLQDFGADVWNYLHGLVVTADGVVIGGRTLLHGGVKIGIIPQSAHAAAAWVENGQLHLFNLTRGQDIVCQIDAEDIMTCDSRVYVKQNDSLWEIEFVELPAMTLVKTRLASNVMEQATQLFDGVALQNMLGAWYATLVPAKGVAYQVRLPELDGCQIIDAKYQNNVLMIVVAKNGQYDKLMLRFGADYRSYDLRCVTDIANYDINFTVLDSGVCLHMNDQDELEVFSNQKSATGLKVIADPAITGDCKLYKNGTQALFARGHTLYKFRMQK
jgi:hypothetical protein